MSPKQDYQIIAEHLYEHTRKNLSSFASGTQIIPKQSNPLVYVVSSIEVRLTCDDKQCEISFHLLSEQRGSYHLPFNFKMFTARFLPLEVVAQMSLHEWECIICEAFNKFQSYY